MLKLYSGSDVYMMADSLLDELNTSLQKNPLHPELFIVQNYGMARWLALYLAEKKGIAANLEFKFPAEIFWKVVRVMEPDIPEALPSERLPMTWAIFQILEDDSDEALSVLRRYIHHANLQQQEMRRWNLAGRIGDVFDQYLTYRPDLLLAWEKGKRKTGAASEHWQATLWQKLIRYWHGEGKKNWDHRAVLQKRLLGKLDDGSIPADNLPDRISIFGVTEMPPVYLRTFLKLSKYTDVHFYQIATSRNTQNALVQSMGQAGRDLELLISETLQQDTAIEVERFNSKRSDQPDPATLFEALKIDLLSGSKTEFKPDADGTVQVHSCHSPRREVEVLYDQLLKILDENEAINASDILVLCPQMERYASAIDAIFGAAEQGLPEIPYHLSDASTSSNNAQLAFLKLIEIADSRFKITDILDLLDFKPIREAFSLTLDDISTLERWISDNRIRWGINAEHKEMLGLPKSKSYTWQAGLHRMMAGFAMAPDGDSLFSGIYPYDEIQHSDHVQLLGRFSKLLHHLFSCHHQVKKSRTSGEWSKIFNRWLSRFFPENEMYFRDIQRLREAMKAVDAQAGRASFEQPVSFSVMRICVKDSVEQHGTGGGRLGQGVTFSAMVQMRNIPAKVVCMIGMDDGAFPRSKNKIEFDLIARYPRSGDRRAGRDDRQLFLENIIAARAYLYFSYTGQSDRSEAEFPPSVVLRELNDFIVDRYRISEENLVRHHRLHAFSPAYFEVDSSCDLFSFSRRNLNTARQLVQTVKIQPGILSEPLPEADAAFKTISVSDLTRFYQHPARFLLQQRIGIFLREDEVLDEDREDFDLRALEKYQIGQDLLNRFMADHSLESFEKAVIAQDRLPENWPGYRAFQQQAAEVKTFGRYLQEALDQNKLDPIDVDLEMNNFQIVGRLNQIFEHEQILYRFGKMRAKDRIDLWIKHLLLQIVKPKNHSGSSCIFTFEKDRSVKQTYLEQLPHARRLLTELLEQYWSGLQRCIFFFPESSYAYAEAIIQNDKSEEQAMKAAQKKWDDDWHYINEGKDSYNQYLIGNINTLGESKIAEKFKKRSRSFWGPFFNALGDEKGEGK